MLKARGLVGDRDRDDPFLSRLGTPRALFITLLSRLQAFLSTKGASFGFGANGQNLSQDQVLQFLTSFFNQFSSQFNTALNTPAR